VLPDPGQELEEAPMRATVNGTELYFDVDGSGLVPDGPTMRERPAVLALHGGPGYDHAYLKPALASLADSAQVVYLDQRGQGRSSPAAPESCTVEQMADDAAALCRALGIGRPVVLGHSYGGYVALALSLRHPDLPGGLVLADTAAHADFAEGLDLLEERHGAGVRRAAEPVLAGEVTEATMGAFMELVLPTFAHPSRAAALADLGRCTFNAALFAYFYRELRPGYDLRARLGEVRAPALVLVGDHDWLAPPARAREIAAGVRGAELVVVPEAGHTAPNERPEVVVDAVRRFLATAAPT
jgi:proline iminopeptidase